MWVCTGWVSPVMSMNSQSSTVPAFGLLAAGMLEIQAVEVQRPAGRVRGNLVEGDETPLVRGRKPGAPSRETGRDRGGAGTGDLGPHPDLHHRRQRRRRGY